jgi:hypothetical protein
MTATKAPSTEGRLVGQTALAAIDRINAAVKAASEARNDRDAAIAEMFGNGMRPPQIADALG